MTRPNAFLAALIISFMSVAAPVTAAQKVKRTQVAGAAQMIPQDSSLVGLHDLRREGNLVCMVGHTHIGSSTGQPTRKAAEVVAMRNWSEFTAWEYGGHWGSATSSANKRMTCSGTAGKFNCDFESRPCRR
jgi:hypothetical protein